MGTFPARVIAMNPLVRKLENFTTLSDADRQALNEATRTSKRYGPREDIIQQGDPTNGVSLVLESWAYRYKNLEDGRRQIMAYFVPGRLLRSAGVHSQAHGPRHRHDVACDDCDDPSRRGVRPDLQLPRVTQALWWATLVAEAITREWLVDVGRRTASERIAVRAPLCGEDFS